MTKEENIGCPDFAEGCTDEQDFPGRKNISRLPAHMTIRNRSMKNICSKKTSPDLI